MAHSSTTGNPTDAFTLPSGGVIGWDDVTEVIGASDIPNSATTQGTLSTGDATEWICGDLFDFTAIPTKAKITGVFLEYSAPSSMSGMQSLASLVYQGAVVGAVTGIGGNDEGWNQFSQTGDGLKLNVNITRAMTQDASFGFGVKLTYTGGAPAMGYVEALRMTLYWFVPKAGGTRSRSRALGRGR